MEITLNLPENVYRNFTALAEKKHRRVEEIITDKLQSDFSIESPDFEKSVIAWSDEDVLALANLKIPEEQAARMSVLSDKTQNGTISKVEESELEIYLEIYNNANLRKSFGIAEAVRRKLIATPNDLG